MTGAASTRLRGDRQGDRSQKADAQGKKCRSCCFHRQFSVRRLFSSSCWTACNRPRLCGEPVPS